MARSPWRDLIRKPLWPSHQTHSEPAAGIVPWPQNVLRHSFCSYAVALRGFEWTSAQADHSVAMLRRHYWEVVSKEDARRYWEIVPADCVALNRV